MYISLFAPEKYMIARIATTAEAKWIYDNIAAKAVSSRKLGQEHMMTEIAPTMYEVKLDAEIIRIATHASSVD